ncbi:PQQ-dependent sugar dehydrogenase [Pseudorhodoferax sp.]|uniref:PQQ-dependent sugar dehydrogenase n=1 Tax=Pseudorhodoferax sp. TaxID=1993553 RepID=UPI002DD6AFD0|nr:PQQ-dependent sugar dehydrogenase [Pseudorhodoferax sp.]
MTRTSRRRRLAVIGLLLAGAGCGGGGGDGGNGGPAPAPPPPAPPPPPPPEPGPPVLGTLHSGLQSPWGLAVLPDGTLLVTQRGGSLLRLSADGRTTLARIDGIPTVASSGQGGLLDVAIDPEFSDAAPWVYLSYAEPGSGSEAGRSGTAVLRARLAGGTLTDAAVIFRQQPKVTGGSHFGSRLVFARDHTLFVTLGDRQLGSPAQDLAQTLGKVVRIRPDGSIPADNPGFGAGARPGLWSIGHRNPQGAALHPVTGELWLSEHGPQGGDEINIARAGNNHGWPLRSHGCDYGAGGGEACRIGGGTHAPDFVEPVTTWVPTSIAPSGLAFYTGDMFPEWRGQLFSGALAGQALWRLELAGDTVSTRSAMFGTLGERFRDVRQAPDGALLLLTDSGKLMRLARPV